MVYWYIDQLIRLRIVNQNSVANMIPMLIIKLKHSMNQRYLQTLVSLGPRLLVQILLLAVFLYFFGFPAVARFENKDVMVVQTKNETNGTPIPAVTLAVMDQINNDTCFHKNASIEDCIEENTLKSSEILKSVVLGYKKRKRINFTEDFLREDFTSTWAGRYYTLDLPGKIGPHSDVDQIFLGLTSNLTYTIFVHDPKYLFFNENPNALPTIMSRFETGREKPNSLVYRLALTEVQKLNRPSSPCNEDADFNFESCLKRSVSEKVFFEFHFQLTFPLNGWMQNEVGHLE